MPSQIHSLPSPATLSQTKQLHALFITSPLSPHPPLAAQLLRSYAAHNDLPSARHLFDQFPQPTTFLYNSIIRAHAIRRSFATAFSLFARLLRSTTPPDGRTFACLLRACTDNSDRHGASIVHRVIFSRGLVSDRIACSALITTYSKLSLLQDAVNIFEAMVEPDLVLWNAMVSGYVGSGYWEKAVEMFGRMRRSGERPDGYSLVAVMSGFGDRGVIRVGRGVHGLCVKGGYEGGGHVGTALVSMYLRCNCLDSGYRVFRGFNCADLVTWSALISGFSKGGKGKEAVYLFREMCFSGRMPDPVLIASVLSACASFASVGPGRQIHGYIYRNGIELDIAVACALTDVYGKCGLFELGYRVFSLMRKKNLVAYNIVISGLASHGRGCEAIGLFEKLLTEGLVPDKATFSAALSACCHSGLLKEGSELFERMNIDFGIEPQLEHYVYMVKLLGSDGKVDEAYDLIRSMPILPDSGVWGALLWACCDLVRVDLGEVAAQRLLEIDPSNTAYRVMLSNIYASKEKWENVENLRDQITEESLQKVPGTSWIGVCDT